MADMTWAETHEFFRQMSARNEEWAGFPMPIEGFRLTLEDRYPGKLAYESICDLREPGMFTCSDDDVDETVEIRNHWYSKAKGAYVTLYMQGGKLLHVVHPKNRSAEKVTYWVNTAGVSLGWDPAAEATAMERLSKMVKPHLMDMYLMTGCFLETSRRSRVSYLLRRARPTLALVPLRHTDQDMPMRLLAALCLHPLGYYQGTWAGAMVPTDDVIAHLSMIRGDEPLFWRRANHHSLESPEAGL